MGHDPAGSSHPGIARDGIARNTLSAVWDRTGLSHHEIAQDNLDGIEISRDCAGRDFMGRKKHRTSRDGI